MGAIVRRVIAAGGCAVVIAVLSAQSSIAAIAPPLPIPSVASIHPNSGENVGVAQPITVIFNRPVAHRLSAQRSIDIISPPNPPGQFRWLDNVTVQWVPNNYWPAHSSITVQAGGLIKTFNTKAKVLGVANISDHTFTVSIDDTVVRQVPASMGKSGFTTPQGSFSVLEKQSSVIMDSRTIGIPLNAPEGYRLTVADAVRITWGGVYVHSAPWSVGSQGRENVSHGCINLGPDDAAWYFAQVGIGDPVIVTA